MRMFVATAVLSLTLLGLSVAPETDAATGRMYANIPPEALRPALRAVAKEYGIQFVYSSEVVSSLRTEGIKGDYTADEALERLLSASGLAFRYVDDRTITIVRPVLAPQNKRWPNGVKRASSRPMIRMANVDPPSDPDPQQAIQGPTAAPAKLQTVTITGSLISRTNLVTPTPVQSLSLNDLQHSGFTSLNEVLQSVPANGQGTMNQSDAFEFAYGGSAVSLRGLNPGNTLVLVDGERTVPFPMLNNNQNDFVDISSFPLYAIDRVDVMANGGSSIYGGDAIAGVVNLILRKQYQGFKAGASIGTSQLRDGMLEHIQFIVGHGDLNADGYNFYVAGNYRHQDQIQVMSRSGLWNTLDWSPFGGLNTTPGAAAAENVTVPFPSTNTGYLINPSNPAEITYLPGCNANAQANNLCLVPNSGGGQLQPASTRFSLLAKFTKELPLGITWGVQASYFDSTWDQVYNQGGFTSNETLYPSGFFGDVTAPGVPFNIAPNPPLTITVPADYPGNPYGQPAPLVYSFPELGPQEIKADTNTYRLLTSLNGTAAGWQLEFRAGAMYARMLEKQLSELDGIAFQTALNNGYTLNSVSTAAARTLFAPTMGTTPTSQLDIADITGTHDVTRLWAREPVKVALGVQWYREVHNVRAPLRCGEGLQICNPVFAIGTQRDTSVYGELYAPVVNQFELDGSVRYDDYQVFGGSTSGSVAGLFTPFAGTARSHWVRLRGSWSRAFRPPSAAEGLDSGENVLSGFEADPVLCPTAVPAGAVAGPGDFPSQCAVPISGVVVANPRLNNVHSSNWEGGLVLEPIPEVGLNADYYNITVANPIVPVYIARGLNAYTQLFRSPTVSVPFCPVTITGGCSISQLVNAQTPVGPILAAVYPYVNAGRIRTSGYDFDLTFHFGVGEFGRFSGDIRWTHELTYQLTEGGVTYELAGVSGPGTGTANTGNPKDHATLSVSWDKGRLDVTPTLYYTGSFGITNPSAGLTTCGAALSSLGGKFLGFGPTTPPSFCSVGHSLYTNLYASYQVNDHFAVHATVQNVFNAQPPLDLASGDAGALFYPYDSAFDQEGAIGRYWVVGASYSFF